MPIEKDKDPELELKTYFNSNNVVKCLNRIESLTVDVSNELLSSIMDESDLNQLENWFKLENLIGCLVNDIETYYYFYSIIIFFYNRIKTK